MPRTRPARSLRGASLAALVGPLAVLLFGAAPAASALAVPAPASLGSVPVVVSDYVGGGGLLARLEELYGPGKEKGSGVDFGATTKAGAISRVYEWTEDRYAHPDSAHPIQLTNYWTVPITIAGKPVGVAAVWINPQDDDAELADFTASASLATALGNVPADAALVHDAGTAAWFAVAGPTANPLVPGHSGVTTATPVAELRLSRPSSAPAPGSGDPNTGLGVAIGVLVLLAIVIVATLVLPGRLRRRTPSPGAGAGVADAETPGEVVAGAETAGAGVPGADVADAELAGTDRETTDRERTGAPGSAPAAAASRSRRPASCGRTPVSQKPPASRPSGTTPASSKPASSKPAVSKPPSSKPAPRPRAPKKPRDPDAPDEE